VGELKQQIQKFYGKEPEASPDFARMATTKHYQELKESLDGQKLLFGGECNDADQYISPTLVDEPDMQDTLMNGEIFGPILPIISYTTEADLDRYILSHPEPLALYVFSKKSAFQKKIMSRYRFGGGAINDTVIHISNKQLPFGGVGQSGMGGYHGKHSFDLFSHHKAVVKRANWLDVPLRYAPYKIPIRWIKKIRHLF
jgi:aldehyde dehydrogenase (NAD+)